MSAIKQRKNGKQSIWNLVSNIPGVGVQPNAFSAASLRENQDPLRAELLSPSQLDLHAQALSRAHQFSTKKRSDVLLPRLNENEEVIEETYNYITDLVHQSVRIPPAGEWLLDNFYVIKEQISLAREHLPKQYSRELPILNKGSATGYPRIYHLATEFISHVDGRIDEENLSRFVAGYGRHAHLLIGELWAMPIMLRMALIENLRRVAERIRSARKDCELAGVWATRLLDMAGRDPKNLVIVLSDMAGSDVPYTSAFVAELFRLLQGQSASLALALSWFEQRLAELGSTSEQLILAESKGQASDRVSIGNTIGSMRLIASIDWKEFVEKHSQLDHILRDDPAGIYTLMDFETRDSYRHVVEKIAKTTHANERDIARTVLELALAAAPGKGGANPERHIGYYLVGAGLPLLERRCKCRAPRPRPPIAARRGVRLFTYVFAILTLSALIAAPVFLLVLQSASIAIALLVGFLFAACASQPAVQVVNALITSFIRPLRLPRMDYTKGIPDIARTIVVVPTMLTKKAIVHLVEGLEIRYLANNDKNLFFALLTDFPDAKVELEDGDRDVLLLAISAIRRLNAKYAFDRPNIFSLLHRPRRWNPSEGVWMGYERKRGKLSEFNHVLRGKGQERFMEIVGDLALLQTMKYVITLDTDTKLPRDSARLLTGTLDHPLNRPVYDQNLGRVTQGYGLLQPRVAIDLSTARRSRFVRIFAHDAGLDPYTRTVSDVYQDLFGEGSFVGKGIYDVDAFELACNSKFPENRILSHDLIEGCFARSGLVTDVELVEEFPARFNVDVSRRHRWMRGDWQIASWILPYAPDASGHFVRNRLSMLSRWKIWDNLRRTLAAPSAFLVLLTAWFLVPQAALWITLGVVLAPYLPVMLSGLMDLVRLPSESSLWMHLVQVCSNTARAALQATFSVTFLCHEAILAADAVVRTLWKLCVRRRLLEWTTASDAERKTATTLPGFYREMWWSLSVPIAVGTALFIYHPQVLPVAATLLANWMFAPAIAWILSQPVTERKRKLSPEQHLFLREIARRTWMYFETFVNAEENWLPPDNFQHTPKPLVAHRTSPTNIGVALLSTLAACDFGYISQRTLLQRIKNTLQSLDKLERYNGHFFNWYDTVTLKPLHPQYVSSVDSGNLLGHLITLRGGLLELPEQQIFPESLRGLGDTIRCLRSELIKSTQTPNQPNSIDGRLTNSLKQLEEQTLTKNGDFFAMYRELCSKRQEYKALSERHTQALNGEDVGVWSKALLHQYSELCGTTEYLIPWIYRGDLPQELLISDAYKKFNERPNLVNLKSLSTWASNSKLNDTLLEELRVSGERADEMLAEINASIKHIDVFTAMNFDFLYSRAQKHLSIGYNVTDHRLDGSYYDLLASEARLASFVAIALQQLPREHWFVLGRKLTSAGGEAALLSWSGSMFEYLMPALVMPTYEGSILAQTNLAVVGRHREYAKQIGTPWGISESGFNSRDVLQNYQYRAFGVPGLGFKRGLSEDMVIAPYASAMALIVDPYEACVNLQSLDAMGAVNLYGFYEALDFTPSRLRNNQKFGMVKSHMSHHQGMAMLGLAQHLLKEPMQRRFMLDPKLKSVELLLQECLPQAAALIYPHSAEEDRTTSSPESNLPVVRDFNSPHTPMPQVQLLSNGRYHVMITNAGGGYSRWKDLAVTRWREDGVCDNWGQFTYLRDLRSGKVWSSIYQPTCVEPDEYFVRFGASHTEFRRRDADIVSHTQICVSPEDDVEIRTLKLANMSRMTRTIEVTTYSEVVLNAPLADLAHPAFSNLFVQTEILADKNAILCHRRPRTASDAVPWMFHLVTAKGAGIEGGSFETDRGKFVGRGRNTRLPLALTTDGPLSNSAGSVLDPIAAIRVELSLRHAESVELQIVTGMANSRDEALALVDKFKDHRLCERAFEVAWTNGHVVLDQLNATEAMSQIFCDLASPLLFATASHRASGAVLAANQRGQSGLWGYGISGDNPLVLLRVSDKSGVALAVEALKAHAYLRMKGLVFDLVIWNEDASTYRQELHDELMGLVLAGSESALLDRPGGVFIRRGDQIAEEDRVLLQALSRTILLEGRGSLAEQVDRAVPTVANLPLLVPYRHIDTSKFLRPQSRHAALQFFNGFGGFSKDGREYVIQLPADRHTPAPWCNVLANSQFGSVVSERGSAYSWCENAHEYRLTPWNNDPVSDGCGECFYIRDDESGRFWSPTPHPAPGDTEYIVRHGFGYSVFETTHDGISSKLTMFVPHDAPVKIAILKLRNDSVRPRQVSATSYVEWVLGETRQKNAMHVVTELELRSGAVIARNPFNTDFKSRLSFASISDAGRALTCDRAEFIGRNGTLESPASMSRTRLSGRIGPGLDPCTALQSTFHLIPEQEREVVFIIGTGKSTLEVQQMAQRFQSPRAANEALNSMNIFWELMLDDVYVKTPDPAVNLLMNGWLNYQVIAARIWARSGFYQSGGAFGFRDQLQDTLALLHNSPEIVREHILRCAARQFVEGDVQHWWHPPTGRGVRTQFSDDYLWLVYAVCEYVRATGDTGVLQESVPFLTGRQLKVPDEEAYYDLPQVSSESATLYEHCLRALRRGTERKGPHGLPLMGCGDWNDGMNLVGIHGKGESVWLAFFLFDILRSFSEIAMVRDDMNTMQMCREQAHILNESIEKNAWDGEWYRRAYFDDGTPLGSAANDECQIDVLPQAWAVLSGAASPERARKAMNAVRKRLVRKNERLIQLFDPPLDKSKLNPGYIKAYVPGVRENGGQYTHGAIWVAMAFAKMGETEEAWELMNILNPIRHSTTQPDAEKYRVEPYVIAADVYRMNPFTGRGGWTWYTGSAGWMYRFVCENLLGIQRRGTKLQIRPQLPREWSGFELQYKYYNTIYRIYIESGQSKAAITVDGSAQPHADSFELVNDGKQHVVKLSLPSMLNETMVRQSAEVPSVMELQN